MATTVLCNTTLLVNGTNLSGVCNEASLNYQAEMLDVTTFGLCTRVRKGGLTTMTLNVKGFMTAPGTANMSTGIESTLWPVVGSSGTIFAFFPTSIYGCQECGFAGRGIVDVATPGGAVGTILPFTASLQSAGMEG